MTVLGIDGGGTKTAFCLFVNGAVKKYITDTCYVADVGEEGVHKVFQGFGDFLKKENLSYDDIQFTVLGMPGFSESQEWDQKILNILPQYLGDKFQCENDCFVGWAGSLACEPGINIIAGTGAIGFAVNDKKETARSSGWGMTIGDEGSGYWLGCKALEVFSKQSDGRIPKTEFHQIFMEYTGIKKDGELIDLVYNQWNGNRTKIASLSKIVYQAALKKDTTASNLIEQAADEIVLMITGLLNNITFDDVINISYSGGIFSMGELILDPINKKLQNLGKEYQLKEPILTPDEGAVLYAARVIDNNINYKDMFQ